jgi:hypothetical protein
VSKLGDVSKPAAKPAEKTDKSDKEISIDHEAVLISSPDRPEALEVCKVRTSRRWRHQPELTRSSGDIGNMVRRKNIGKWGEKQKTK